eukprot:TRINITY_DN3344_c1_g1_i1.p1 TRINITY_DN3344_c1_g1~~TRINITY_DN3344_c1_g1_i1.p1  ORF type:complete len:476 (+),score=60.05 TRINITY_DN3344_c1_g1_i1:34-1461(+)
MPPKDVAPPETDKYVVLEMVGKGAYGAVHKARRKIDGKILAVKVTTSSTEETHTRQLNEVKNMLHLRHRHVVRCLDFFVTKKKKRLLTEWSLYIVMPLYEGDLVRTMGNHGNANERSTKLILQIGEALRYLHQQAVIHRDVKPENILIDNHNNFVLADLGVAKHISVSSPSMSLRVGTYGYIAPEHFTKNPNITNKVDMWALGMTITRIILTWEEWMLLVKYMLKNKRELVISTLIEKMSDLGLEPVISNIVTGLLRPDPSERFSAEKAITLCGKPISLKLVGGDSNLEKYIVVRSDVTTIEVTAAANEAFKELNSRVARVEILDPDFKKHIQASEGTKFNDGDEIHIVFDVNNNSKTDYTKPEAEQQLHYAAERGDIEKMIHFVKTHGADPRSVDTKKRTLLHVVAGKGHLFALQFLINTYGLDPGATDDDGKTPLVAAVSGSHVNVVRSLVEDYKQNPAASLLKNRKLIHYAV